MNYRNLRSSDLRDIMYELDCYNALEHYRNFDYCFLQYTDDIPIAKELYIGHFLGNTSFLSRIGCSNNMNQIFIDDPFFRDRIIKVVFKKGISISDYFRFDEMKKEFNASFTEPKQKDPNHPVLSPFIHKDFCGENFDGDVYSVLMKVREK